MKNTDSGDARQTKSRAVPALISAVIMISIWAYLTITTAAPGWVHVLLTLGVFLLIYGIVVRDGSTARNSRG